MGRDASVGGCLGAWHDGGLSEGGEMKCEKMFMMDCLLAQRAVTVREGIEQGNLWLRRNWVERDVFQTLINPLRRLSSGLTDGS